MAPAPVRGKIDKPYLLPEDTADIGNANKQPLTANYKAKEK